MKLYIANCSQQTQEVNYRIPESPKPHTQRIEIGQQVLIGSDQFSEVQVNSVIDQQRRYGMLAVGEIGKIVRSQIPLVFSTGNPVTGDVIRKVMSHNRGALMIQGQELRKQAALAVHSQLDEASDGAVRTTDMSVEEISSGSMSHDTDGGPLSEGIIVKSEMTDAKPKGRGRNKK